MAAQETLDAELIALAALANHDAAQLKYDMQMFGEQRGNYYTHSNLLEEKLRERGVYGPQPGWETFCCHANENPNVCPCPASCGCRHGMCKSKPVTMHLADPVRTLKFLQDWRKRLAKVKIENITEEQMGQLITINTLIEFIEHP